MSSVSDNIAHWKLRRLWSLIILVHQKPGHQKAILLSTTCRCDSCLLPSTTDQCCNTRILSPVREILVSIWTKWPWCLFPIISNYFLSRCENKFRVGLMTCQVRYNAHSPMVLLGVSCKIRSGERVGIVGRTGSGKSTFIQALFRMVEPVHGSIIVDDVDISTIGIPAKHKLTHNLKPALCTTFEHSKPPSVWLWYI